jgi:hypothetical protein
MHGAGLHHRKTAGVFQAGKTNFEAVYKPRVNAWALYDNSDSEPVLLDWGDKR